MASAKFAQKPLEILIVGTGAIGAIFGARAQTARSKVTTVCRSNYDAVSSQGIRIKSILWGNSVFRPDRVVRAASEVSHVNYDYVVLATKSSTQGMDPLLESIRPAIKPSTTLVSVQNGVSSELALSRAFENPIFSSTCYISCAQTAPGFVEQVSSVRPHAFYVGIHRPGRLSSGKQELDTLVSLDDTCLAKVEDAHAERWRKVIFNTAWSLSTSLLDKDTHQVLADNHGVQIVLGLAREAYNVALSLGIKLSPDLPSTTIESARRAPCIVPSMLQDIRKGKPIEVEALCGGIYRTAQQKGIDTPILEMIYGFLSKLNRGLEVRQQLPGALPMPRSRAPMDRMPRPAPRMVQVQSVL